MEKYKRFNNSESKPVAGILKKPLKENSPPLDIANLRNSLLQAQQRIRKNFKPEILNLKEPEDLSAPASTTRTKESSLVRRNQELENENKLLRELVNKQKSNQDLLNQKANEDNLIGKLKKANLKIAKLERTLKTAKELLCKHTDILDKQNSELKEFVAGTLSSHCNEGTAKSPLFRRRRISLAHELQCL